MISKPCPCHSELDYSICCADYIAAKKNAPTPLALMRSRYTAYTETNIDYILKTMKSPAADDFDPENARAWASNVVWRKLVIISSSVEGDVGFVEFMVFFTENQKQTFMHEKSEFHLIDDIWYYIDGMQPALKIGRNDLCPCGSQNKFKKCCGE